ncbi:MAG: DUF5615 family PIN-like protein [Nitrospirae bacterium]|nr:DUF5615 family PIN-like protein [Nitrospirota bacterium]
MKFFVDENVSRDAVEVLRFFGHDVTYVNETADRGRPDTWVFERAQKEGRLIVTRDRALAGKCKSGSTGGILIAEGNLTREEEARLVRKYLSVSDPGHIRGKLVVLVPGKAPEYL